MTALPDAPKSGLRPGVQAAAGAVLLTFATVAGTLAFLAFRASEQRRVLDARTEKCRADDAEACDLLRSACLKRSGDACGALADALTGIGPRKDPREALRLFGEACAYHHRSSCVRAGRMHLDGEGTVQSEAEARRLFAHGCELGDREACSLAGSARH